ncbi:hypothetical protein CEXT_671941 [Caerostris extrusa]|uniref:Uncharacterized protein n=1 Tax=Caerostris extrusa TaxID=172846 RepID=A0AAV4WGC4_CAEEX|nr:hypothetical protein CEXT_671941 [Caerostris extrusa]
MCLFLFIEEADSAATNSVLSELQQGWCDVSERMEQAGSRDWGDGICMDGNSGPLFKFSFSHVDRQQGYQRRFQVSLRYVSVPLVE